MGARLGLPVSEHRGHRGEAAIAAAEPVDAQTGGGLSPLVLWATAQQVVLFWLDFVSLRV